MAQLVIPFSPQAGDPLDPTQIDANFASVQGVVNGLLEAGTNVLVGSPAALRGDTAAAGTSSQLSRADHSHVVRGVERLASDPTSGNWVGRLYFNTSDSSLRYCTDASAPTFVAVVSGGGGSGLPAHGSTHSAGGSDAIPNGGISEAQLGRAFHQQALSANTAIGTSWTNILNVSVTLAVQQLVTFISRVRVVNSSGANAPSINIAMTDDNAASWEYAVGGQQMGIAGAGNDSRTIYLSFMDTISAGTHVFRVKGKADVTGASAMAQATLPSGGNGAASSLQLVAG